MSRLEDLTMRIVKLYERNSNPRRTRDISADGMDVMETVLAAMVERGIKTEQAMDIADAIMDKNVYFREIK